MKRILDELYEGEISPTDDAPSPQYLAIMDRTCVHHAALADQLGPEGEARLNEYRDILADLEDCAAKDSFQKGFRMGARMILALRREE